MSTARAAEFAAFQQMVLACNKQRLHAAPLALADARAEGANPLCGDRLEVQLQFARDQIQFARYQGEMSAITTAAAERLCAALEGLDQPAAMQLLQQFMRSLQPRHADAEPLPKSLGDFAVLKHYPNRLKTATLPAATLLAALRGEVRTVSTETSES